MSSKPNIVFQKYVTSQIKIIKTLSPAMDTPINESIPVDKVKVIIQIQIKKKNTLTGTGAF